MLNLIKNIWLWVFFYNLFWDSKLIPGHRFNFNHISEMNQQAWYLLNIQSRAIRQIYVIFLVIFLNAKYSSWSKIAIIPSPSDKTKQKSLHSPYKDVLLSLSWPWEQKHRPLKRFNEIKWNMASEYKGFLRDTGVAVMWMCSAAVFDFSMKGIHLIWPVVVGSPWKFLSRSDVINQSCT